ncbi:Cd GTPase activating protein-related [Carabus blaptoides fortunei]
MSNYQISVLAPPSAMWFTVVRRRWQQRKSDARNVRKFHNGGSQNQIYVQSIVYYWSVLRTAICTDTSTCSVLAMQLSDGGAAQGSSAPDGAEPCRFPKLEECAHFHYERVQLPSLSVTLQNNMDQSLHSQHTSDDETKDWYTLQVTCMEECWLIQRSLENFTMLDAQLHQCIYDRKVSQLPEISTDMQDSDDIEATLSAYLQRFCCIVDNSLNCGPILNWFQLDNRGHRLLVPSEESRSINTPAVAAAYSIRKYVSQARDELSLEVGDMISVIDMASPGESVWWRGKRGFQVGFFPQHCVHIIGDKVPRNMPLPPPVVGSLAISPIKPVLRKHGKLITFFRSFILNRPSRRRLKQSGILKERVFGCDLGEHLLNSGHEIPMVLKCCTEFIETHGIVDGIYRLSGVTSNIQKLRNAFDEDRIPNLYTADILQDIHSVASLLKMYFRELPNPLCTYQLYHSFVQAVQGCSAARNKANDNERLLKMREAVQKLPPPHYRTLEYLMRHLARVAKHGANTGMTTRNVAIVWAPNLLRCEELEIGGVAALQGVGVQAVVTEFLVCYADLIFCDHLPNLPDPVPDSSSPVSPKRSRPKSLAISTPTKLLTLEEARNKHLLNKTDDCNYIEVGGGPKTLPKKYHTVIELPPGSRKRGLAKRSPSGWRSFFSKSRNSSHGNLSKNREISSPGVVSIDNAVTDADLNEMKRKLRPVKSAESLTSGQSEPATCDGDVLGPLHCLTKPPGHNRSVSHDSYFDNLQTSTNNSVGSLLDLSEIQLNFELEELEMRIFSEDESLVSSPKVQREAVTRKVLSRARPEDFSSAANSSNPSPKKQARVVISPDSLSRKRSRLEDQLSDIQYIDCSTPDNPCTISTTAVIHHNEETPVSKATSSQFEGYQPKNKSPRNSNITNRHSLNFEKVDKMSIPKSLTEMDIGGKLTVPGSHSSGFTLNLTPTPQTPNYKPLEGTSSTTTPILTPDTNHSDAMYTNLNRYSDNMERFSAPDGTVYENLNSPNGDKSPASPNYENIKTTISIIYKSPVKSANAENIYEDVELNPEKAVVPTTAASLPVQEASQPTLDQYSQSPVLPISPVGSPRLSLETTFDASIVTVCSDSISGGSSTLKDEAIDSQIARSAENIRLSDSDTLSPFTRQISSESVSRQRPSSELSIRQISSETLSHNSRDFLHKISNSRKISNENISLNRSREHESATNVNSRQNSSDNVSFNEVTRQKRASTAAERPKDLKLTNKSVDDVGKSFDSAADMTKSSDSLSSLQVTPCDNSRKSLPSPTDEISMSEVVQSSLSTNNASPHSSSTSRQSNSPALSPVVSPINVSNCTSQMSHLEISAADEFTRNDTNTSSRSSLLQSPTKSHTRTSLEPICKTFGSTDELSSSYNKSFSTSNDKRKSCDAEILDENAIYQQVKYFRRSVHEINSLLDLPSDETHAEEVPLMKSESADNSSDNISEQLSKTPDREICLHTQLSGDATPILDNSSCTNAVLESMNHFDSLEPENIHLYENVEVGRNHKDLDTPRSRMHDCEPKKLDITPDIVQDIPVCSKCSDPEPLETAVQKSNVRNLTSKFETKENSIKTVDEPKNTKEELELALKSEDGVTNCDQISGSVVNQNKHKAHNYDKDNLPPCLRAKNAKNSIKTRSLDENAFVTEFGRANSSLQRRKSLDDRTSSYINSKLLVEPQKVSSSTTDVRIDSQLTHKAAIDALTAGTEQKLNRERIEKYKEERRNFLREKYRSESFKEDKEKLLSRLKQKAALKKADEAELMKDSLEYEPKKQIDLTPTNNTVEYKDIIDKSHIAHKLNEQILPARLPKTKEQQDNVVCKKLSMEALSKFEKDGAVMKPPSFRKHHSPLMDRRNRPSLKELSDKILDETSDETVILRGAKEEEFLRHRRGDGESERRRHTYDLMRERDIDTESQRRVSLEAKTPRKDKCSPSYCIKDMKAIFESKSHQ